MNYVQVTITTKHRKHTTIMREDDANKLVSIISDWTQKDKRTANKVRVKVENV